MTQSPDLDTKVAAYQEAFGALDVDALRADLIALMTDSQEFWPADFGHYGGLMIRLAWHSAGTFREFDGKGGADGGAIRFSPLSDWPDNGNLDKAIQLLQPVKDKHPAVSWADLIVLSGNVALESMGFETLGFGFGRIDYDGPEDVDWGPEDVWLADERHDEDGELAQPYAADQKGLIYVNPEGPGGEPDPLKAAPRIRDTFKRMGMDDEETVALIAGGHTFGKTHGDKVVTSGLEVTWSNKPTQWGQGFLENLHEHEYELTSSPQGANQWVASTAEATVPDAEGGEPRRPGMLTTDLSLRMDPAYAPIAKRFYEDPDAFRLAFAKAWFKLLHRDLPYERLIGPWVPERQPWQDAN